MLRLGYAQSRRTSRLKASGKRAQGCQLQLRGRVSRRMLRLELPINAMEKQTKGVISTSLKAKGKLETPDHVLQSLITYARVRTLSSQQCLMR